MFSLGASLGVGIYVRTVVPSRLHDAEQVTRAGSGSLSQWVLSESKCRYWLAVDQMLLYDLFQRLRCAGVIPGPFRIHHRNGATCADLEAIRLGAINECFWASEL